MEPTLTAPAHANSLAVLYIYDAYDKEITVEKNVSTVLPKWKIHRRAYLIRKFRQTSLSPISRLHRGRKDDLLPLMLD